MASRQRFLKRTSDETIPVETPTNDGHPAYRLGAFMNTILTRHQERVASFLNQGQHCVGFPARNGLLGLLGLIFLLYFIALLTQ